MRGSPGCRCRTGCTRRPRARSSTRSSAPRARSPRGRARRWPPLREARSWSRVSRTTKPQSSSRRSRWSPGLLYLAFALLRLGWISRFLSKAVITGFLAGAAVDVVIGELPKLTGNRRGRGQRVARARLVDRLARRRARLDGARRRARPGADPRPPLPEAGDPGCARPRRGGDPRGARVRPRGARRRARRRRAERAAGARAAELRPDPGAHRDDRRGGDRAAAHRVLADRGGRPRVRRAAQVPRSTSTRNRWLRAWRTSARASSRACRSRRASPPAR